MQKPVNVEMLKVRAEEMCARGEYSSGEMRARLLRRGATKEQAEAIIESLIERRFIDDSRFARVFVREKIENAKWGRRKISMTMYQKGLGREVIETALDDVDEERYVERLARLLKSKLKSRIREDAGEAGLKYEDKVKLYRFAASRGFESYAIANALELLINGEV